MTARSYTRPFHLLCVTFVASTSIGCANLGGLSQASFFGASQEPAPVATSVNHCVVQIRKSANKSEEIVVPITPESRVQDVLTESGAIKKFGNMKIFIVRQSPKNPTQKIRLQADFDPKERQVTMHTDYGVFPGDRIIVGQDDTNAIDRFISRVMPAVRG